jgi:hypothetical protein
MFAEARQFITFEGKNETLRHREERGCTEKIKSKEVLIRWTAIVCREEVGLVETRKKRNALLPAS